jgi:hypothetical protein
MENSAERMPTRISGLQWLVLCGLALCLVLFWSSRINGELINKDAADNLRMALNFKHTGVISNAEQPPFRQSMFREPVPIIATLLTVDLIDAALGPADNSQYFSGERARWVKHQNIFWMGCLCIALFVFVRRLTPAFGYAVSGILIMNLLLFSADAGKYLLNSLYTEAPAAVLLTLASLLLSSAVLQKRLGLTVLAGVCFGVLALVKASFLYVLVGVVIVLPCLVLLQPRAYTVAMLTRLAAVLALSCFAVVTPWMLRNYLALGTFGIASRGGEALYIRAVMDQMTAEEYLGTFYMYAPYGVKGAMRHLLGLSREELANGLRLQRLDESGDTKWADADLAAEAAALPDKTYTFYRRAGADRNLLIEQFRAAGALDPGLAADHVMGQRGAHMIMAHPWRHLAQTLPNLWRGAFLAFPLLLIAVAYAWRRRDLGLLLLLLPAFAMVTFYGLVSPYLPRYTIPVYAIVVGSTLVLVARALQNLRTGAVSKPETLVAAS